MQISFIRTILIIKNFEYKVKQNWFLSLSFIERRDAVHTVVFREVFSCVFCTKIPSHTARRDEDVYKRQPILLRFWFIRLHCVQWLYRAYWLPPKNSVNMSGLRRRWWHSEPPRETLQRDWPWYVRLTRIPTHQQATPMEFILSLIHIWTLQLVRIRCGDL